jgi:hypothetical protein
MASMTTGTLAGTGSFRCEKCGYILTLAAHDALPACPSCGAAKFDRASLFGARFKHDAPIAEAEAERDELLLEAHEMVAEPGQYLVFIERGETQVAALTGEWTRIGRSLAADVRLDDPTISRRHALIVRGPDGLRVMDDRSLNGVFVNGERVEWRTLEPDDEIVVGRYRLHFLDTTSTVASAEASTGAEA